MSNIVPIMSAATENPNETPEFDAWDAFWTLYPRHESKKDAAAAWEKIGPSQHVPILVAVTAWRKIWAAEGRERTTIPYPATWLRGERWDDEVPPEFEKQLRASHVVATVPDLPRKSGEIPAHVLAQIAKLKAAK